MTLTPETGFALNFDIQEPRAAPPLGSGGRLPPLGWGGGGKTIFLPPLKISSYSRGLSVIFSKMLELFSGRCRWRFLAATTKGLFFSKLPFLQMPALQSWSGCQPVPTFASRLQVLLQISLYSYWVNPPPPGLFLYPPQPGGGGSNPTPPAISKTDRRRETDEAAFERSRRDASKQLSKI